MSNFCGGCGTKLNENVKFCPSCGKSVNQEFAVDLNQQLGVNSSNIKRGTYKMITGIVMISLGVCLILAAGESYEDGAVLTYTIPGVLGLIGGILDICSRKNHRLLKPAGILFLVAAGVNFLAIFDISIYAILSIVFGILNIVYSKKN